MSNKKTKKPKSTLRLTSPSGIEYSIEDRGTRGFYFNHSAPWGVRMRDLITRAGRDEAIKLSMEMIEHRYRSHSRGPGVPLSRVVAEMMVAKEKAGASHDYTRKIEEHSRLYILPALGASTPIGNITSRELLDFKHGLDSGDLDRQTCNRILVSMRQIFKYAADPCGYIDEPALPRNFPVAAWATREAWQILSPDDISKLLAMAPPEIRLFLGYVANTGLRVGTALATEVAWIDFQSMVVRYPASVMKGRVPHVVELNEMSAQFLRDALAITPEKPFPFSYWYVLKPWLKLREAFGRPGLRLHDLRHSFISNQLAAGTPVHVVQQMAAHRSLAVTALYSHGTDEARRAAAGRVQIGVKADPLVAALPPNLPPRLTKAATRNAKSIHKKGGSAMPRDRIELPTRGFSTPSRRSAILRQTRGLPRLQRYSYHTKCHRATRRDAERRVVAPSVAPGAAASSHRQRARSDLDGHLDRRHEERFDRRVALGAKSETTTENFISSCGGISAEPQPAIASRSTRVSSELRTDPP